MRLRALMDDIIDQLSTGRELSAQECLVWSKQLQNESRDMLEEYCRIRPDPSYLPVLEAEA